MEGPTGADFETAKYYPSSSRSLEEGSYVEVMDEKSSNLSWILRTGLSIGKKFVISGLLMSSVPVVLPPLVVISALGIASSVPFGFVCASYACTEELMSKLLPPPSQLDYEELMLGEEEEEFVATGKEEYGEVVQNTAVEEYCEDEKTSFEVSSDVCSELSKIDREAATNIEDGRKARSVEEFGIEGRSFQYLEGTTAPASISKTHTDAPMLDNRRQKNNTTADAKAEKKHALGDKIAKDEERTKRLEKDMKLQDIEKGKSSSTEIDRKGKKKSLTTPKPSGKKKGPKGDKMCERENLLVENEKSSSRIDSNHIIIGSRKLKSGQNLLQHDKNEAGNILEQRPSDVVSHVRHKLASETAEDDVFADNHSTFDGSATNGTREHILGTATLTKTSDLKQDEKAEKRDLYRADPDSGEGLSSNEKIWREIDAIRLIVGSKAPRLPSYWEELKALYLFTGIDPPALFGDLKDMGEFHTMLQFLKSVIGLK